MRKIIIDNDQLETAAFILKTVAHPARLAVIQLLRNNRQMSVGEISERLEMEQSLTSHHLNNMKIKGILNSVRDGKQIYYFLREKDVAKIIDCIENCKPNR